MIIVIINQICIIGMYTVYISTICNYNAHYLAGIYVHVPGVPCACVCSVNIGHAVVGCIGADNDNKAAYIYRELLQMPAVGPVYDAHLCFS